MKKIILMLSMIMSPLIASDVDVVDQEQLNIIIAEAKNAMRPLVAEIVGYASDPKKDRLIEKATGMPSLRIVKDCEEEMNELCNMLDSGVIDLKDFCDGTYHMYTQLPTITTIGGENVVLYRSFEDDKCLYRREP